jgi:predicted GIY-YIG superfamily endonuclease
MFVVPNTCTVKEFQASSMPTSADKHEADRCLRYLKNLPFDDCLTLSRSFLNVPQRQGFYAFKHCTKGILYIGVAADLRRRFLYGHKALAWAFLDRLAVDDIRLATLPMTYPVAKQAEAIELLMLKTERPVYNREGIVKT